MSPAHGNRKVVQDVSLFSDFKWIKEISKVNDGGRGREEEREVCVCVGWGVGGGGWGWR